MLMWNPLQVQIQSYVQNARKTLRTKAQLTQGYIYVLGDTSRLSRILKEHALPWQLPHLSGEGGHFVGKKGPVWIFHWVERKGPFSHQGRLEDSTYSWHRDQVGSIFNLVLAYKIKHLHCYFNSVNDEAIIGSLVGLDLASYRFREMSRQQGFKDLPTIELEVDSDILKRAVNISTAVNWARHLVNTPPNILNPESFSQLVKKIFRHRQVKVEVWDSRRLSREKMGLHLAVGQGALHGPRLAVVKYRPSPRSNQQPIVFIGKGITFDSGGLDIKPSSNMRLMKKDMGGAAALFGLAHWVIHNHYSRPVDFYFGLAENSVDAKSFRPGDIIESRSGQMIEIHNTDAEGRLVLADVLDVAAQTRPKYMIDVATLTGAIKAGLGSELSGLFSNSDELSEKLLISGQKAGDLSWRMPLYPKVGLGSTSVADLVNATDGFGGAVSAALFLEKFVKQTPWAHFDIYAWNDKPTGALSFSGGNGQAVQCLIEFLRQEG